VRRARLGKPFGAAAEQIAATVRASEVIASDETSARVKGKTHWQWAFGCATAVYQPVSAWHRSTAVTGSWKKD
jgi:transposase